MPTKKRQRKRKRRRENKLSHWVPHHSYTHHFHVMRWQWGKWSNKMVKRKCKNKRWRRRRLRRKRLWRTYERTRENHKENAEKSGLCLPFGWCYECIYYVYVAVFFFETKQQQKSTANERRKKPKETEAHSSKANGTVQAIRIQQLMDCGQFSNENSNNKRTF